MQNLLKDLTELLSEDERLVSEGKLLKNKVAELALKMDADLIKNLLKNAVIKKHFFSDIDGILVFDKIKFQKFVSNKEFLPDSYTAFKNKIGLVNEAGDYLSESKEVILAWPYKDCVLEGGQTKEDQKRDEIFWNETLAPDEIDRLLAPKVLTNFKKYDMHGEQELTGKEAIDFSMENLIIKGNNLLALHSLYKRFAGKVKLINIDPPFNTGNDSFRYNDSFNHSTWLTFMKNRLEIAKKLLSETGSIFIQLDDNETAYAKVLCDDIFGRENYCNQISIETNSPFGYKSTSSNLFKQVGYVLMYSKMKKKFNINKIMIERAYDPAYHFIFDDIGKPEKEWQWRDLFDTVALELGFTDQRRAKRELGEDALMSQVANYALSNAARVFRTASVTGGAFAKRKKTIELSKNHKDQIIRHPGDDMDYMFIGGERVLFYKERLSNIDGQVVPATLLTDLWTDIPIEGIAKEGGVVLERGKKPELLLKRFIELTTEPDDIVLDYHLGSGTTCAVAHKMGRQYIGIEQLDYEENDSAIRLQNVIKGDQSGISKSVNWKGGGSFIYCELMQYNEAYIDRIQKARTTKDLLTIWNEMQVKAFISYKVDPKAINENISDFEKLSLDEQKRFLIEVLDKNQLYVNYSEIDDKEYGVSDTDKKLNRKFYGEL